MKIDNNNIDQSLDTTSYKFKEDLGKIEEFKLQLEKAFEKQDKEDLKKVCSDFETIFMKMLYKEMKATIPESDFMPKTFAREVFEEMHEEEIISKVANGKGMGLGDMLFKQLSLEMENTYKPSNNTY